MTEIKTNYLFSFLFLFFCLRSSAFPVDKEVKTNVFLNSQKPSIKIDLDEKKWVLLSYHKIPSHQVNFHDHQLQIKVNQSAGPLIYQLEQPQKIRGFHVKGKFIGAKKQETTPFDEDAIFRLGVVVSGKQKISGWQKIIAADWVKKLFSLAPPDQGIDKIHFFNVSNRLPLLGKFRLHPKSNLIQETISTIVDKEGLWEQKVQLPTPLDALALWIAIDGDDTKSSFEVSVFQMILY